MITWFGSRKELHNEFLIWIMMQNDDAWKDTCMNQLYYYFDSQKFIPMATTRLSAIQKCVLQWIVEEQSSDANRLQYLFDKDVIVGFDVSFCDVPGYWRVKWRIKALVVLVNVIDIKNGVDCVLLMSLLSSVNLNCTDSALLTRGNSPLILSLLNNTMKEYDS